MVFVLPPLLTPQHLRSHLHPLLLGSLQSHTSLIISFDFDADGHLNVSLCFWVELYAIRYLLIWLWIFLRVWLFSCPVGRQCLSGAEWSACCLSLLTKIWAGFARLRRWRWSPEFFASQNLPLFCRLPSWVVAAVIEFCMFWVGWLFWSVYPPHSRPLSEPSILSFQFQEIHCN